MLASEGNVGYRLGNRPSLTGTTSTTGRCQASARSATVSS